MSKKINVLDIDIDNYTAKEAMQEAIAYMESDPVNVIDLVTVDGLMELEETPQLKDELGEFDIVLAGDRMILEAADVTESKCLQETENKTFLRMFLRYLSKNHKRVYLLVESEEEGQKFYSHFESYYKGAQIVGMAKVSAQNRADDMLMNAINGEEADCIVSALSSPLQEDLAAKNKGLVNARVWLGMGKGYVPADRRSLIPGKFSRFVTRQIFKKEIEKRKKRGN